MSYSTSLTVTQQVMDTQLPALVNYAGLLDFGNTYIADSDRTKAWDKPKTQYGYGFTVAVRRAPRSRPQLYALNSSSIDGPITKTYDAIQEETVNVTVNYYAYDSFQLNTIQQRLFYKEAEQQEIVSPAMQTIAALVDSYILQNLLLNSYLYYGSGSTNLSGYESVGAIQAAMMDLNMPERRALVVTPQQNNLLTAANISFFNEKVSENALVKNQYYAKGFFDKVFPDTYLTYWTSGTASELTDLTLSTTAANGATSLTLTSTGLTGLTFNVGDLLTINTGQNVFLSRPINGADISNSTMLAGFVVAQPPNNSGTDYDASGGNVGPLTDYGPLGAYTATGDTITIYINPSVSTDPYNKFSIINAPSDELGSGLGVTIQPSHWLGFAIADGAINFASPRMIEIQNAVNLFTEFKGINLRYARQGQLTQEQNVDEVGCLIGVGIEGAYSIRVMTAV